MRLLLLNPFQITSNGYDIDSVKAGGQYAEAPIGLGYISSYCRKQNGVDTKVIDVNIYAMEKIIKEDITDLDLITADILTQIKDYKPDIVGISCLFHVIYKAAHKLAMFVKEIDKSIVVVMGGCYPTASPHIVLKDKNIDYIVLGEGERPMSGIIAYLKGEKSIEEIEGVGYKKDGRVVINSRSRYIEDINNLPFPDRKNFPISEYSKYGRHTLKKFFTEDDKKPLIATMTATRGCPYNCSFCISKIFWNRTFRYRDPKSVLEEIELLVKEYGVTHISFNDDNFTVNRKFAEEVLKGILKRRIDVKWTVAGGLCLPSLDKELIELMLKSGCVMFNIAIESANPRILKKIHKPLDLKLAEDKIRLIRSFNSTYVVGFFMVGFPDETEEEFLTTLSYGKNLDLDWVLFCCVQAYPGTELYNEAIAEGLISEDTDKDFEKLSWRHSVLRNRFLSKRFIEEESYKANLESNFINNRNLYTGNLDQAIRDFKWVVEMIPDHAIGYYSLYKAYRKKGDDSLSTHYLSLADKNMNAKNKEYFKYFNITMPREKSCGKDSFYTG